MHPYTTELLAQIHRTELLREARAARHIPAAPAPGGERRLRTTVGFWLVGLGLRLAVLEPAR